MKYFAVCAVALSLIGCGGGSGSDSSTPVLPTEPSPPAAIGLWFGQTSTIGGGTAEIAGIVTSDGRARFTSLESVETVKAQLSLSDNDFSSSSASYFYDGQLAATGEVSGTANNGVMTGTASAAGETISFSADRLAESDDGADLEAVSGNYASNGVSVGIDVDGVITGSDVFGCLLTGSISIIDADYNVYDMTLNVENCGEVSGTYDGLAAYGAVPFDNGDAVGLVFSIDNGTFELSDFFIKN